jgi:hypothetical protein
MALMRKFLMTALALVCVFATSAFAVQISSSPTQWYPDTSQSVAQHYAVSTDLSYVLVTAPAWEQGASRYELTIDGPPVFAGYEWTLTTTTERYAISGNLDLLAVSNLASSGMAAFAVDARNIGISAPGALAVQMPFDLALTTATGALTNCMLCALPEQGPFFGYDSTLHASGTLTGNVLALNGATTNPGAIAGYTIQGGLTAPALPASSYADAYYSYVLVASVPEPSHALMLLCGLLLILLMPRISHRVQ